MNSTGEAVCNSVPLDVSGPAEGRVGMRDDGGPLGVMEQGHCCGLWIEQLQPFIDTGDAVESEGQTEEVVLNVHVCNVCIAQRSHAMADNLEHGRLRRGVKVDCAAPGAGPLNVFNLSGRGTSGCGTKLALERGVEIRGDHARVKNCAEFGCGGLLMREYDVFEILVPPQRSLECGGQRRGASRRLVGHVRHSAWGWSGDAGCKRETWHSRRVSIRLGDGGGRGNGTANGGITEGVHDLRNVVAGFARDAVDEDVYFVERLLERSEQNVSGASRKLVATIRGL